MNRFWNFIRNDAGERILRIDGMITDNDFLAWLEDGTSAKEFRQELNLGEGDITVWINSEGGDCFAATSIYNALKKYRGHVTIKIDSLAASAASVVAMAGDVVEISRVGMIMIHNPWAFAEGDSAEMKSVASMLDEVKETIINAYETKTKLPRAELSRMMDETTFLHAQKAVELGFADKIIGDEVAPLIEISSRRQVMNCMTNAVKAKLDAEKKSAVKNNARRSKLDIATKRLKLGGMNYGFARTV